MATFTKPISQEDYLRLVEENRLLKKQVQDLKDDVEILRSNPDNGYSEYALMCETSYRPWYSDEVFICDKCERYMCGRQDCKSIGKMELGECRCFDCLKDHGHSEDCGNYDGEHHEG